MYLSLSQYSCSQRRVPLLITCEGLHPWPFWISDPGSVNYLTCTVEAPSLQPLLIRGVLWAETNVLIPLFADRIDGPIMSAGP